MAFSAAYHMYLGSQGYKRFTHEGLDVWDSPDLCKHLDEVLKDALAVQYYHVGGRGHYTCISFQLAARPDVYFTGDLGAAWEGTRKSAVGWTLAVSEQPPTFTRGWTSGVFLPNSLSTGAYTTITLTDPAELYTADFSTAAQAAKIRRTLNPEVSSTCVLL